ncbi:hypothetical protein [Streptomyces sp. 11-1-2]|uniref:hypothetical protein n=1 Tax=Streptomyces sp. 11-1-2 TaxID=1851167 RepID=UPI001F09EB90|nr:hypothetical protein [Streptomyces sp. 11-1-2]
MGRVRDAIVHALEALGGKILAPVLFKRSAVAGALVPDGQALARGRLDLNEVVSGGRLRGLSYSDHGGKDCCGGYGHCPPSQGPHHGADHVASSPSMPGARAVLRQITDGSYPFRPLALGLGVLYAADDVFLGRCVQGLRDLVEGVGKDVEQSPDLFASADGQYPNLLSYSSRRPA